MNVQKLIRDFIVTTGTDLYTLVATRVWHSAYPQAGQWTDGTAGIVFNIVDTKTTVNGQSESLTVEFKCHGADRTHSAAQAVERALYNVLHYKGTTSASGQIHRAVRTGRANITDPDSGWPYTMARYQILCTPN